MNFQPKLPFPVVEVVQSSDGEPEEETFGGVPRLILPHIQPVQAVAERQQAYPTASQFRMMKHTPFLPTPETPVVLESFKPPIDAKKYQTEPQVPFPTPSFDFSRTLRAGMTYIPPSMVRHKEPTLFDALIACSTLILLGLIVMMLLYYFSI